MYGCWELGHTLINFFLFHFSNCFVGLAELLCELVLGMRVPPLPELFFSSLVASLACFRDSASASAFLNALSVRAFALSMALVSFMGTTSASDDEPELEPESTAARI